MEPGCKLKGGDGQVVVGRVGLIAAAPRHDAVSGVLPDDVEVGPTVEVSTQVEIVRAPDSSWCWSPKRCSLIGPGTSSPSSTC